MRSAARSKIAQGPFLPSPLTDLCFPRSSQAAIYTIDELTGGLELSHKLLLSAKDYPGAPGPVREMKWTSDGAAAAMSWCNGGLSLWSTFGATLMCSLGWDYGLNVDLAKNNPLNVASMDWSVEGYQLFMVRHQFGEALRTSVLMLDFVKSALTSNPCMVRRPAFVPPFSLTPLPSVRHRAHTRTCCCTAPTSCT